MVGDSPFDHRGPRLVQPVCEQSRGVEDDRSHLFLVLPSRLTATLGDQLLGKQATSFDQASEGAAVPIGQDGSGDEADRTILKLCDELIARLESQ
jgi:hypothetical protein